MAIPIFSQGRWGSLRTPDSSSGACRQVGIAFACGIDYASGHERFVSRLRRLSAAAARAGVAAAFAD